MSCPSKCDLCEHESKTKLLECGPDTFGKTKERYVCRNYECNAFSENHLYPGETIPEKEKLPCSVPDLAFTAEDEQPLFEVENSSTEEKVETKTKETPKKKSTNKKGAK